MIEKLSLSSVFLSNINAIANPTIIIDCIHNIWINFIPKSYLNIIKQNKNIIVDIKHYVIRSFIKRRINL